MNPYITKHLAQSPNITELLTTFDHPTYVHPARPEYQYERQGYAAYSVSTTGGFYLKRIS